MGKGFRRFLLSLFLVGAFGFSVSEATSLKQRILGKWKEVKIFNQGTITKGKDISSRNVIEFSENFKEYMYYNGTYTLMNWEGYQVKDNLIYYERHVNPDKIVFRGDTLTLSFNPDYIKYFVRLRNKGFVSKEREEYYDKDLLSKEQQQQTQRREEQQQQQAQQERSVGIGEWVQKGTIEAKANEFFSRYYTDKEVWQAVSGDYYSDEEFERKFGHNYRFKYVVVDLTVKGTSSQTTDFDFWNDLSLYSTVNATSFVSGSRDYEAVWQLLNGDKRHEFSVTRNTSVTRRVPFSAGSTGIYRLNLEAKVGQSDTYIELGYEP